MNSTQEQELNIDLRSSNPSKPGRITILIDDGVFTVSHDGSGKSSGLKLEVSVDTVIPLSLSFLRSSPSDR